MSVFNTKKLLGETIKNPEGNCSFTRPLRGGNNCFEWDEKNPGTAP